MINVILADDHKLIRDAIRSHLTKCSDVNIVGEAANGFEVLDLLKDKAKQVDIAMLDINMDGMDGIECASRMYAEYPEIKILVLSMYDNSLYIKQMIKNGVAGYLLKHADEKEIITALRTIKDGKTYYDNAVVDVVIKSFTEPETTEDSREAVKLTPRECEILELIMKEYSNQEIADELFISSRTVDAHKRNLLEKTNSKNLAGLIKYAYQNSLFKEEVQ
ncbi:MAG: response regulator transcription factor [Chitinophagales bacterium]